MLQVANKDVSLSRENANEVFLHHLADGYDAEYRFLEGQQEMVQKAPDQKRVKA